MQESSTATEFTKSADTPTSNTSGADILEQAAKVFRERNQNYKDNYIRLGKALEAMFPQGLTLYTAEEWTRFYFFMLMLVKVSRYAVNFDDRGHADSSMDACVYAAMLHAYDKDLL